MGQLCNQIGPPAPAHRIFNRSRGPRINAQVLRQSSGTASHRRSMRLATGRHGKCAREGEHFHLSVRALAFCAEWRTRWVKESLRVQLNSNTARTSDHQMVAAQTGDRWSPP